MYRFTDLSQRKVSPTQSGADHYLELAFTTTATLEPGESTNEMQLRFNKTDWTNFNEMDDWSYLSSSAYVDTSDVTVYWNGVLIWGKEPQ